MRKYGVPLGFLAKIRVKSGKKCSHVMFKSGCFRKTDIFKNYTKAATRGLKIGPIYNYSLHASTWKPVFMFTNLEVDNVNAI